jgi:hypothetical protein
MQVSICKHLACRCQHTALARTAAAAAAGTAAAASTAASVAATEHNCVAKLCCARHAITTSQQLLHISC